MKGHGSPENPAVPEPFEGVADYSKRPGRQIQTPTDAPFGASLEPVLRRACQARLSAVNWFRTDWQRGGALTGYASYLDDSERQIPVVVKLPVPPIERLWLRRLQNGKDLVPRLYADADRLNGYDIAWVVMERVAHGPLGPAWEGVHFDLLVEAAGRYYAASKDYPTTGTAEGCDWSQALIRSRECVRKGGLDLEQRWAKGLKRVGRRLDQWLSVWNDRPVDQWCHGDLHMGNALTRCPPPGGPALLIDFALTHPGNWVEDAVYLEHLYWARRDELGQRRLCRQIAQERKRHGLVVERDWSHFAQVHRALLAMAAPTTAYLGGPRYLEAALEVLEQSV